MWHDKSEWRFGNSRSKKKKKKKEEKRNETLCIKYFRKHLFWDFDILQIY